MIEGVQITPLRQILDERGKVMHMLKVGDPAFQFVAHCRPTRPRELVRMIE